jgi:hypothetical protein
MKNKLTQLADILTLDISKHPYHKNFNHLKYGNTLEPGSMPAPHFYNHVVDMCDKKIKGLQC